MKRQINLLAAILAVMLAATGTFAQNGLKIGHTVSLSDVSSRQLHITTEISNIHQPQLSLSLPTWAPGWYTIENYYKNVLRFEIKDKSGKILPLRMTKKQTWSVDTRGLTDLRIDYDYRAEVLALNQAKVTNDYAFFTGIELFLEPVGHREVPSSVKFNIPAGWRLHTPLKATADPMTFTAANYDVLVDSPVLMGKFDLTKFDVEGKPHYFAAVPAGAFNKEKTQRFIDQWTKVIKAFSKMFGGLPYDDYTAFYFFQPAESNASGALEHLSSYVAFAPAGERATPEGIIGTAAHEYFHLWNVKRIRPSGMWPYDYSREDETPLLWFSEGLTSYYSVVGTYRAGLTSTEQFLARAAGVADYVENTEARKYISPSNSSVSTWVGYDTPVAFGISYYSQGQNLGSILDLSILNDSDGKYGLDDVMRALYNDHYKRGRGFTTEDTVQIIKKLTGKDHTDLYDRYVWGTETPDYDKIFGYAGYRIEKRAEAEADLGFSARPRNGGFRISAVTANGPADKAGLHEGDVIVKINGTGPFEVPLQSLAGKEVTLLVDRGGKQSEMKMTVGTRDRIAFSLVEVPNATPRQLKIRNAWLKH